MRAGLWIIAFGLPALELVGIYPIWQTIGAWTLAWLALAAAAGVWLLRREHRDFLPRLAQTLALGHTPLGVLLASFRRVIAALLLIFPGLVSDALALILLAWPGGRPPRPRASGPRPAADDVIEGEYRRID
ncbi:MAG: FxsA family protein [Thiobacillaceae bacterium]